MVELVDGNGNYSFGDFVIYFEWAPIGALCETFVVIGYFTLRLIGDVGGI